MALFDSFRFFIITYDDPILAVERANSLIVLAQKATHTILLHQTCWDLRGANAMRSQLS